ncbi:tRNA pseudouridine(55) synthase TruB [Chloroflexota bacterium]
MNGILNIDKPAGKTSFSIVDIVKRLAGERRVGHAGTLDPAATGVLPVCLGQGTRVVEYLVDATKAYRAEIELGVVTDTYDASGNITYRGDPSGVSREQLEAVLAAFCGLIEQTPPMYSAVKHYGKPLYKLARAGLKVDRKSRQAKIYRLDIVDWQTPVVTVEVVCGKGTYIRSLAYDLGQDLGCGAHLKSLIRLRCGSFCIEDAISMSQLEDAFRYGYWRQFVYPMDIVFSHMTAMVVGGDTSQAIKNGRPIGCIEQPPSVLSSRRCRAYTDDGCFLGVLRFNPERKQWQPEKVFL